MIDDRQHFTTSIFFYPQKRVMTLFADTLFATSMNKSSVKVDNQIMSLQTTAKPGMNMMLALFHQITDLLLAVIFAIDILKDRTLLFGR